MKEYRPRLNEAEMQAVIDYRKSKDLTPQIKTDIEESKAKKTTIEIPVSVGTAMSITQLAKLFEIDLDFWIPSKQIANLWGNPDNPNRQVKVTFTHRDFIQGGQTASEVRAEFLKDINAHQVKYEPVKYAGLTGEKHVLEIAIYDLHYGRLTWDEESGANYDIKIARKLFNDCIDNFIKSAKIYSVEKIIFPIGNDFFNVDNAANSTTKGTPQSEDSRPMKTFRSGRQMIVEAVDKLRQIAPVEIIIIPGNHDSERIFYLGDTLKSWYKNDSCVGVDDQPIPHKFRQFGKCMIGLTHNVGKKMNLPAMMAEREPKMWAASEYREWHTGHCHHDSVREEQGIRIRITPSLAPPCDWTVLKGYKSIQEAQMFVWSLKKGMVAKFNFHP